MTDPATEHDLTIDIVSDVVCPWCVVGYKSLEQALDNLDLGPARRALRFRPFELNPTMPDAGQDLREHLRQKYGASSDQSRATRGRLVELGNAVGFSFNYSSDTRIYNTFRAHQLLHWAALPDQGGPAKQIELKLALFEAYFTRNEDVSAVPVLVRAAGAVGLDESAASAVLYDALYADEVRAEEEIWRDKGIHAVPSVVFDGRMLITGAQDVSAFETAIERALAAKAAE